MLAVISNRDYRTIQIEREVHKKIKTLAAEEDTQIKILVEKLVDDYIRNKKRHIN